MYNFDNVIKHVIKHECEKHFTLQNTNGFLDRYYAISELVSPVMAWAFLGPDSEVKSACQTFVVSYY